MQPEELRLIERYQNAHDLLLSGLLSALDEFESEKLRSELQSGVFRVVGEFQMSVMRVAVDAAVPKTEGN